MATSERGEFSAPVFLSGTFSNLFQAYQFELRAENIINTSYGAMNPNLAGYNVFTKPFYHLRDGFVNLINQPLVHTLWMANGEGEIWTSSAASSGLSGYLVLYNTAVYPTYYASNTYGLSLRCITVYDCDGE